MYIKKAHLNVKRGVEDVVGVPLGGDSDPPAMRAQHPFHFQISCHLIDEKSVSNMPTLQFLGFVKVNLYLSSLLVGDPA